MQAQVVNTNKGQISHEIIGGAADAPLVLLCDHASNAIPEFVGTLGIGDEAMARHIAYDIGARGVTLALADRFGAPAILSCFSRLVIDPNRGLDDPTLIMELNDGAIIPGNRGIGNADRAARIDGLYRPYHAAIEALIGAQAAPPVLVSIHSFTQVYKTQAPRPWEIGVLYAEDDRIARPLMVRLAADGMLVGDNEPYHGRLIGDCMDQHGLQHGRAHVLIELRNDLISNETDQRAWADRLAPHLAAVIAEFTTGETHHG